MDAELNHTGQGDKKFQELPRTEEEVFSLIAELQEKHPDRIFVAEFDGIVPTMGEVVNSFREVGATNEGGEVRSYSISQEVLAQSEIASKIPDQWVVKTAKGPRLHSFQKTFFILIQDKPTIKLLQP